MVQSKARTSFAGLRECLNFLSHERGAPHQATRVFDTTRSLDDANAIYQNYCTRNGWTISATTSSDNFRAFVASKDGAQLQISIDQDTNTQQKSISLTFASQGFFCSLGDLPPGAGARIQTVGGAARNIASAYSSVPDVSLSNNLVVIDPPLSPASTPTATPTPPVSNVQFDNVDYRVPEGAGYVTVGVRRTGDTSRAVSVDYSTSDFSAQQRSDYTFASGRVKFGPGETLKTFQVLIVDGVHPFRETKS